MENVILVVGLLLTGYCLLIAAKPEWFKNFRVARHDSDGDYRGSSRLGDSPPGVVRVIYLVIAGILLIATFMIRSWVVQDDQCADARGHLRRSENRRQVDRRGRAGRLPTRDHRAHQVYDLRADP